MFRVQADPEVIGRWRGWCHYIRSPRWQQNAPQVLERKQHDATHSHCEGAHRLLPATSEATDGHQCLREVAAPMTDQPSVFGGEAQLHVSCRRHIRLALENRWCHLIDEASNRPRAGIALVRGEYVFDAGMMNTSAQFRFEHHRLEKSVHSYHSRGGP